MLMGLLALLLIVSVPLFHGDLRRLSTLDLRAVWVLPVALGLQVLVITIAPDLPRPFTVGTHLMTYLLAATFIWVNRRVAGLLSLPPKLDHRLAGIGVGQLQPEARERGHAEGFL